MRSVRILQRPKVNRPEPMAEDLDHVWKALSDPTRRKILDLLRLGARSTTEIVTSFPDMTRHAVMKHIDVLRVAGLVNTREEGRRRINSLNVVPIRQIYERWVGPFAELWSAALLRIKDDVESSRAGQENGKEDTIR